MSLFGKNLNIVLLGKTGNGKSATGNSIAGMAKFQESLYFTSTSMRVTKFTVFKHRKRYTLYDTRGLCNVDTDLNEDILVTIKHMQILMKECPEVDVFFICLNMARFTAEDNITIERLKIIFGQRFINQHCYLVVTHGDKYDENIPFETYCEQLTGGFHDLYIECSKRIFLISNKGDYGNNSVRVTQGDNLIAKLQEWLANRTPYRSDREFTDAAPARRLLAYKGDTDNIRRNFQQQIYDLKKKVKIGGSRNKSDLKQELYVLRSSIMNTDPDVNTINFKNLLDEVTQMISDLEACAIF